MNIPQILQQLNGASIPNLGPVKQMMNMVRGASDPNAMLSMLAQSNPQMQQAMSVIQQAGGDPQQAFYSLCEQKGVDPNKILDALK